MSENNKPLDDVLEQDLEQDIEENIFEEDLEIESDLGIAEEDIEPEIEDAPQPVQQKAAQEQPKPKKQAPQRELTEKEREKEQKRKLYAANQQALQAQREKEKAALQKKEQKRQESGKEDKPHKKGESAGFFASVGKLFARFGRKCKEVFGELKNVTWAKYKDVLKKTGIVLAVATAFVLVFMGIDQLMNLLYKLLISGM